MQTPGQRDRADRVNAYIADATAAEIEALRDAREFYEEAQLDDNADVDAAYQRLQDAEAALDAARDRAWESMPTM